MGLKGISALLSFVIPYIVLATKYGIKREHRNQKSSQQGIVLATKYGIKRNLN